MPSCIKSLTNCTEIINIVCQYEHGISFAILEILETEYAINLIQDFQIDPNFVFIPEELVPDTPIITLWDNIDQLEETLMGAGTSHRCNGIGVQPKSAQPVDVKMIEPKSKQCRRSLPIGALDELEQYYTVQRQSPGHLTFLEVENCTTMLKHQSMQYLLWIFARLVNPMQQIMPSWTSFFISVSRPFKLWKPKTLRSQKLTWSSIANLALEADKYSQMVDTKQIVTHALNATTLLGCAHQKLNNRQKESIAPALPKEIREVCSSQREVTSWLFGNDLAQAIKEAKEINKLSNEIATGKKYSKQQFENPRSTQPQRGYKRPKNNFRQPAQQNKGFQQGRKPCYREKPEHP